MSLATRSCWNDDAWNKDHPNDKDETFLSKDSVEFSLDLTTAAIITVEQMNKEGDMLAADDVARVVVPPPKDLSVLLVTEGNYYFEHLLESLPIKDPKVMTPQSYEDQVPTNFNVIFFDS